jgi:Trypsin-co-occurring domain 1
MTHYIQFQTSDTDGSTILVEVDNEETSSENSGLVKVSGVSDIITKVFGAKEKFETAIKSAVQHNVEGLIEAIQSLPEPPTEVEITFALKATGQVGNFAVVKGGGEANYSVKLTWKQIIKKQSDGQT